MFLKIHESHPSERKINQVVKCLRKGGVIIYPTDTVYALGCAITQKKAVERICRIKGVVTKKMNFSFVCADLSHLSEYAAQLDKGIYRLLNRNLPDAFTFILQASSAVPKLFKAKKTVGIRVPNNNIARQIVRQLGQPILSTSLKHEDEILKYLTDPSLIYQHYQKLVDLVIDGGMGGNQPSTVVDLIVDGGVPVIVRQGKGVLS